MKKMKAGEGDLYAGGIKTLLLLKDERLVVGAGDGMVELIEIINKNNRAHTKSSISKLPNTPQIFTVSRKLSYIKIKQVEYIKIRAKRNALGTVKVKDEKHIHLRKIYYLFSDNTSTSKNVFSYSKNFINIRSHLREIF